MSRRLRDDEAVARVLDAMTHSSIDATSRSLPAYRQTEADSPALGAMPAAPNRALPTSPSMKSRNRARAAKCLALLAAGLLASCSSVTLPNYDPICLLGTREVDGGIRESATLNWGEKGGSMLVKINRAGPVPMPFLGLACSDLTPEAAAARGVAPWSGVLITAVKDGTPAAAAGFRATNPMDVILSLDGTPTVSAEQFTAELQARKKVGEPVVLQVLRGQTKIDFTLAADAQTDFVDLPGEEVQVATLHPVDLAADFSIAELPEELANRIYGIRERALVAIGVASPTAAWNAGLRTGDRITAMHGVEGQGTPTLAQVKVRAKELVAGGGNFSFTLVPGRAKDTTKDIAPIQVSFAPGHLDRTVREVWIPWLHYQVSGRDPLSRDTSSYVDIDNSNSYWSFGPFDTLMSYRHTKFYYEDRSQGKYSRSVLDALLGLIRVETDSESTEVRLLWFLYL